MTAIELNNLALSGRVSRFPIPRNPIVILVFKYLGKLSLNCKLQLVK